MRTSMALLALSSAAAVDTEAPKITLDLFQHQNGVRTVMPATATNVQTVTCLASSENTAGATQLFKTKADCAGQTNCVSCPEPTYKAWDHHDGDITNDVDVCHMLINLDGTAQASSSTCQEGTEYTNMRDTRSEWVFTYDVEDRAGNQATTVSFSMVFVDEAAPELHDADTDYNTESCDRDALHQDTADRRYNLAPFAYNFYDAIDGDMTSVSTFTYTEPGEAATARVARGAATYYRIDTKVLGAHVFDIEVEDRAGIFGQNGANNAMNTHSWTVTVQDNTAPRVYCNKAYCHEGNGEASGNIVNTFTYVDKLQCCDQCQTQARSRLTGTVEQTAGTLAECTHFTFAAGTCTLHAGVPTTSVTAGSYSVLHSTNVGIPMACMDNKKEHWECGTSYTDPAAVCVDIRDNYIDASTVGSTAASASAAPNGLVKEDKDITYTCTDATTTNTATKVRKVHVRDTTPPTLKITTAGSHAVTRYTKYGNGLRHAGSAGAVADDWIQDDGHAGENGEHGIESRSHRNDLLTIQHSAGYLKDLAIIQNLRTVDEGFKCEDLCPDGSPTISTSWVATDWETAKPFNNIVPDTYVLKYVCRDAEGNTATKARTVINEDKTKPVIRILGQDLMTLEATHDGNYVDDGATCSDQVDGMISENVEVSGDVVNLSTLGKYTISYNCKDSAGNAADTAIRIVYVLQTSCPTCRITGGLHISREASFPYYDEGVVCTDLIDGDSVSIKTSNPVNVEEVNNYEVTYRAMNSIGLWSDGEGGACRYGNQMYTRTVSVVDTLQPVITLRYGAAGTTPIQIDRGLDSLANSVPGHQNTVTPGNALKTNQALYTHDSTPALGDVNPANTYNGHSWMAEQAQTSSVNGWVVGAVGSAVTGLALLGYSMRKTSVATSVPV